MPPPTDHEARRQFVISVSTDMILAGGMESISVRNVAAQAKYSTSIVTHYFKDKNDLLLRIYQGAVARNRLRLNAALEDVGGLSSVLFALLPTDPEGRRIWGVYLAYLGCGVVVPALGAHQARAIDGTEAMLARCIVAHESPKVSKPTAVQRDAARRLLNFINGTGISIMLAPEKWTPARVHKAIAAEIAALSGRR